MKYKKKRNNDPIAVRIFEILMDIIFFIPELLCDVIQHFTDSYDKKHKPVKRVKPVKVTKDDDKLTKECFPLSIPEYEREEMANSINEYIEKKKRTKKVLVVRSNIYHEHWYERVIGFFKPTCYEKEVEVK